MPGFLYLAAIDVARRAHEGQTRKYTGEPYITHPFAVAGLVASVTRSDNMIIASILHDVVEDSDVNIKTIRGVFGKAISELVSDLTDISKKEDGNRALRKKIDRNHTKQSSPQAKTIKLADLIDNTKSIVLGDSSFAKVYMEEKRLLLNVLRDGDKVLFDIASRMVNEFFS